MEYQIEPIRLSYPELDAGPNPNIMTERLTRYYVAEETPDDGNCLVFQFKYPTYEAFNLPR